jgi:uncharacterized membrane protein YgaE (UPF0421/DUF939 family)
MKIKNKFNIPLLPSQILTMTFSMLLAELLAIVYPVDQSFWIPLTTFCVCLYINTPLTALRRTIHRILGSIYGVILAGCICLLLPDTFWQMFFLTIFSGLTLWSRAFTNLYYIFVTFMTASVIMLLAVLMSHTDLTPNYLITERLIFTIIGALIALIVAISIMPTMEKLDMLKTYKHYLLKFFLEYKAIHNSNGVNDTNNYFIATSNVYSSSQTYQEKLPLWRYALFFNSFIYRSFVKFLHRIHKMRIMNCIILNSMKKNKHISEEINLNIKANVHITKKIITYLILLQREKAQRELTNLSNLNIELEKLIRTHQENNELITILITIKDLEQDLRHLTNGALQIYLAYKQNHTKNE